MKILATVGVSVLLLPVLVIGAAMGGTTDEPSQTAITQIPANYLALYQEAAVAYGIPWELLAGVGKVECDNGQSPDPACTQEGVVNSAGAGGPMQFLADTWARYGVDADGDGKADRWDPADAIFSAANYLHASGAPSNTPAAVYAYNHSNTYVTEVLTWAAVYTDDSTTAAGPETDATAGPTSTAQAAVAYALDQLGTPYSWGGEEPGGFDCSGLVQAAYAAAGIQLPRIAQAQYDAGPPVPAGQPLQPGDLVFFGASSDAVDHVGIVVAAGEMVDAPHSGAVVRVEPYAWADYLGATRPT